MFQSNPIHFRFEVSEFIGVEWITMSLDGLVPFHSQNEFHAHLNGGRWITVACIRATQRFDGDINDIV